VVRVRRSSATAPVGATAGRDSAAVARVLGVDPGTVALGWGIVETHGNSVRHIASGVVRARGVRADRLAEIYTALCGICREFAPTAVSLDQTFVGDNVQSAFRLGEARGAVMVAASQAHLAVAEYSPAEIKVAVAGSGRASKAQMQTMVGRLLGLETALATDEADALGAAICHLHSSRLQALVAQAPGWGVVVARRGRRAAWRR
jgi:crossover junction endodeoxyribonuclease RuvC